MSKYISEHMLFERGNAVIVGKKAQNDDYEVDGVLVYDAYCLSSGIPYLLQATGQHFKEGETIYICGHGKGIKISDYTMEEIANMLCNNYGYAGKEDIKIMSCHAKNKNNNKDMGHLLEIELKKMLQMKNANIVLSGKVEAVCEHVSVVMDYFNQALVVDQDYKYNFMKTQEIIEKDNDCFSLIVNSETAQNDLSKYFGEKYIVEIAKWNYSHTAKRREIK